MTISDEMGYINSVFPKEEDMSLREEITKEDPMLSMMFGEKIDWIIEKTLEAVRKEVNQLPDPFDYDDLVEAIQRLKEGK